MEGQQVVMEKPAQAQAQPQKLREALIIEQAVKQISEEKDILFDPQGHALVVVTPQLEGKEAASVYCNIDISKLRPYSFQTWLEEGAEKANPDNPDKTQKAIDKYLKDFNEPDSYRHSVIPLGFEADMHLRLLWRALQKHDNKNLLTPDILKKAQKAVNDKARNLFQIALDESYDPDKNEIDYVKLNKKLDEARETIKKACAEELIAACFPGGAENDDMQAIFDQLKNSDFTETTATGMEYLVTDNARGTVTTISKTENTAHNKKLEAASVAARITDTKKLEFKERAPVVTEDKECPMLAHARVPSLSVPDKDETEDIDSIKQKFAQLSEDLLKKDPEYVGPIYYNLYTSLPLSYGIDELRNDQKLSAERILSAANEYNKIHPNNPIYVINVPVNEHGKALKRDSSDSVVAMAASHAERGLISILARQIMRPEGDEGKGQLLYTDPFKFDKNLKQIIINCSGALEGDNISRVGADRTFANFYANVKAYVVQQLPANPTMEELAGKALLRLLASDQHNKMGYGYLVQALAIYLEPVSFGGCKSGNERTSGVEGRVAALRSASPELKEALKTFITNPDPNANADALNSALNMEYDRNLQIGAANAISLEDQGASSKVEQRAKGFWEWFKNLLDTNRAESAELTHLSQSNSSGLQAHKGNLAKELQDLTPIGKLNWLEKLLKNIKNYFSAAKPEGEVNNQAAALPVSDGLKEPLLSPKERKDMSSEAKAMVATAGTPDAAIAAAAAAQNAVGSSDAKVTPNPAPSRMTTGGEVSKPSQVAPEAPAAAAGGEENKPST